MELIFLSSTKDNIESLRLKANTLNIRCNSCTGQGQVNAEYTDSEVAIAFDGASLDLNLDIKSSGPVNGSITLPLTDGAPDVQGEGIHVDLIIQTTEAVDVASGLKVVLPKNLKLGFDVAKAAYLKEKSTPLGVATGG